MARRHSKQPIPPFPDDIDRERFGSWLSGFTDGEGCFYLHFKQWPTKTRIAAFYLVALRDDDWKIIGLIQRFLRCGTIHPHSSKSRRQSTSNPALGFQVRVAADLEEIVVPQFERYPLMAKKARDFAIWRRGVAILYRVTRRRRKGYQNGSGGCHPRWTPEEHEEFRHLAESLKAQRQYQSPDLTHILPPAVAQPPGLFDGLA